MLPPTKQPAARAALRAGLNLQGDHAMCSVQSSAQPRPHSPGTHRLPGTATGAVLFVATDGVDTNPGTEAAPFATLHRAAIAAAAAAGGGGLSVVIRQGKYFLNTTLQLGPAHSNTAWSAFPGEPVVLSGGVSLSPRWSAFKGDILKAPLNLNVPGRQRLLSSAERLHWSRRRWGAGTPAGVTPPPPAAPNPSAPPGFQRFVAHCMSEKGCTKPACGCASRSYILKFAHCAVADCYDDARAACAADKRCTSFAIPNGGHPGIAMYETYAGLKNDSAVPDADWTAYAEICTGSASQCKTPPPVPPAPPAPPGPPGPPGPGPIPPHEWGAPPARVNSLFVDGVRQVKARYPNGNPQDSSGLCFAAVNRPGEGCDSYLAAQGGVAGTQPASTKVAELSWNINRGDSPSWGCPQCTTLGSFGYIISEYPEGHPVYNAPLPGIGWGNHSLFRAKGNPDLFSRPAGVVYGTGLNKTYVTPAPATTDITNSCSSRRPQPRRP